jgi:hypothetical protein
MSIRITQFYQFKFLLVDVYTMNSFKKVIKIKSYKILKYFII